MFLERRARESCVLWHFQRWGPRSFFRQFSLYTLGHQPGACWVPAHGVTQAVGRCKRVRVTSRAAEATASPLRLCPVLGSGSGHGKEAVTAWWAWTEPEGWVNKPPQALEWSLSLSVLLINIRRVKRCNCLQPENILKTILEVSTCVQELVGVTNQTQHCQTIHALKQSSSCWEFFLGIFELGLLKVTCPSEFYDRNVTTSKFCASFKNTKIPFYSAGAPQDEDVGSAFLRDGC